MVAGMAPTLTPQQREILERVRNLQPGEVGKVLARAGTGKTFVLVAAAADQPNARFNFAAFGKDIAEDAKKKFGRNTVCKTAHAYARREVVAMPEYKPLVEGKLEKRVWPRQTVQALRISDVELPVVDDDADAGKGKGNARRAGKGKARRGRMVRGTTLVQMATSTTKKYCQSTDPTLGAGHVQIAERYMEHPEWVEHLTPIVLGIAGRMWEAALDPARSGEAATFTFNHMLKLWLDLILAGKARICAPGEYILVDEAQDLNPVMAAAVAAHTDCRVVYVGDPEQAIFESFTGSVNAMENVEATWTLPLTQSWRFGPAIAATANLLFDEMGVAGQHVEGTTTVPSHLTTEMEAPDAVLCRTNASLMAEVIAEQGAGRTVALSGGNKFRGELERLINAAIKLKAGQPTEHTLFVGVDSWGDLQEYTEDDPNAPSELVLLVRLEEKYGLPALSNAIHACRENAAGADVVISTVHKAKGLEWDRVRIADDFTLTYPNGHRRQRNPEAAVSPLEEFRVAYVAVTRARVALDPGKLFADNPASGLPALRTKYTREAAHTAWQAAHPALHAAAQAKAKAEAAETAARAAGAGDAAARTVVDPWGPAPTPPARAGAVDGVAAHRRYMRGPRRSVGFDLPHTLLDAVLEYQRGTPLPEGTTPHDVVAALAAWALASGADVGAVLDGKERP